MSKAIEYSKFHGIGEIVCTCDGPRCNETESLDFEGRPSMNIAQQHIEFKGWFSRRIGDSWYDFHCPGCYQDFLKKHGL